MSDLVGNPKDMLLHNMAQMTGEHSQGHLFPFEAVTANLCHCSLPSYVFQAVTAQLICAKVPCLVMYFKRLLHS